MQTGRVKLRITELKPGQFITMTETDTEAMGFVGGILEVLHVEAPFVIVFFHSSYARLSDEKGVREGNHTDFRKSNFIPITDEYVKNLSGIDADKLRITKI